jgi:hypothetical protein
MRFFALLGIVLLAGCTPAVPAQPGPAVSPTPAVDEASPPAIVPDSAWFEPADFPGAGWRVVERSQGAVGTPEWAAWLSRCPGHRAPFDSRQRRLVDLCPEYEFVGRDWPPFRERATVLAADFLLVRLIREEAGAVTTRYVTVDWRGDTLVTVELTGVTEAEARLMAGRAVARLERA